MYFKVCEYCGAHLDCGEKCDCQQSIRQNKKASTRNKSMLFGVKPTN